MQSTTIATTPEIAQAVATKRHATVRVTTPQGATSPIVAFEGGEYGYVRLESSSVGFGTGQWTRGSKRSTLLKGELGDLRQLLEEEVVNGCLPGKLIVEEFELTDEFLTDPQMQQYRDQFDTSKDELADQIARLVKRAGKEGPVLKVGDNPILRFTNYVHTDREDFDQVGDRSVQYDNVAEVKAYQDERKTAEPTLAGAAN